MDRISAGIGVVLLCTLIATGAAAQSAKAPVCPCTKQYDIQQANIGFLGELLAINYNTEPGPGFPIRNIELVFHVLEPWRNAPHYHSITLTSDDTSCGYGDVLAPPHKKAYTIGQHYGVFAERKEVTICNSMIVHTSLLFRTPNRDVSREGVVNPLDDRLRRKSDRQE